MSLEVPSDQPISPPLTVEIPSSTSSSSSTEGPSTTTSSLDSSQASSLDSSQASSLDSSPAEGIQDSPTSASCSSLPTGIHHLTIKFAPLPELAPRKRRSTAPLGMAARTQLTRRRRSTGGHNAHSHSPTAEKERESVAHPMWTEEEMEEHKRRQRRLRAVDRNQKGEREEGEEVDDPLLVLGRLVKVAGKQLWRKVSHRDRDRDRQGKEKDGKKNEDAARMALTTISSNGEDKTPPEDTATKDTEKEDHDEDGGIVWEDANADFLNVGQTETFLEAPYSS